MPGPPTEATIRYDIDIRDCVAGAAESSRRPRLVLLVMIVASVVAL